MNEIFFITLPDSAFKKIIIDYNDFPKPLIISPNPMIDF